MNRHDGPSLNKTLVLAAAVAALGTSVGVPLAHASAPQPPNAHDGGSRSAAPLVLAFTLVEEPAGGKGSQGAINGPGAKRGMGDGSVRAVRRGTGATQAKMKTGATQGKERSPQELLPARNGGIIAIKPGAQVPAVQKK